MRHRIPSALALVAVLAVASPGAAQAPGPPPQDTLPQGPIPIPPPPDVNDPMLAPVPPAPQNIASWDEALAFVKARSTDLRIARLETDRAAAQSRIALAALLPSINGTTTATHNFITNQTVQIGSTGPGGTPTFTPISTPIENFATGGGSLVQPLVNVRLWYARGTALEAEKVTQLQLADAQRTISLNVANAIVGVVTAERIAELNRIGFRSALERLDLTRRKRALGAANGLDVVRAQQDVESARATLVTGDESLRQAREALGLALGIPHQVGVPKGIKIDGLEAEALRSCKPAPSLDDRPDVAAARQNVYIAHRNINDVWYQFLPTVNAQSAVATTTINTGAAPNTTWNIQAVLSVPLWDGGARYGNLRDTRAQESEAQMRLEALRRSAAVQIEQARRNVEVSETSQKVAEDARALAAETDRLTQVGYAAGQGTSLELVTAAAALRQADINLALKQFALVQARILAVLSLATCPW
jgi:outer membrane protein TolC